MKETGPDAVPPPESCSFEDRRTDRLVPVPLPNLNSMPSDLTRSRIDSIESWTELMKHAEPCWERPDTPRLNQTGLLNDACCVTRRNRSSWPHFLSVSTTRSMIWRTLVSRSWLSGLPWKYF